MAERLVVPRACSGEARAAAVVAAMVANSVLASREYHGPEPDSPSSPLAASLRVSRSSPDLVSRKNRLNQPRLASGLSRQTHRTYENLADTVAYSQQAFSSEELDRVYPVQAGPASVSAQFVTQSALVAEIARSQPAEPPAPPPPPPGAAPAPTALLAPPAVDPQGPGSPSHFLSGNIRVSSVGPVGLHQPAAGADEPIYENVDFHPARSPGRRRRRRGGRRARPVTPEVVVKRESTAIPREQRCQAIEARISNAGFFREFESVVKKRDSAEYTTARRPENENKNRFRDVLPYEDNRVRVTPSRDNPTGYINASHISVSVPAAHGAVGCSGVRSCL
ncbi:uncharacterized protein LOC119094414 [Pollicipes pollicipes]|uniref:uncharacterized protein LOC119094414 n=1 Tax=Pollicipes pollicipes TaxID=41117 RepID=UPI00188553DE|nr:uncharacterized protein LOC119094414 [Pollicipes pollicipes]